MLFQRQATRIIEFDENHASILSGMRLVRFSGDEVADLGVDEGTPVTDAYEAGANRFTGKIHKMTVVLE